MSLKVAFDFVRSKRWFIRPNTGFFQQLIGLLLSLNFFYDHICSLILFYFESKINRLRIEIIWNEYC